MYQKLNQVTRPFRFPIPRCNNAAADLGAMVKYLILVDMYCGFWQVVAAEDSKPKMAFFVPGGIKTWSIMPMGLLNSHAIFVAMMAKLQQK